MRGCIQDFAVGGTYPPFPPSLYTPPAKRAPVAYDPGREYTVNGAILPILDPIDQKTRGLPRPSSYSMVLILDGNSEHNAHV